MKRRKLRHYQLTAIPAHVTVTPPPSARLILGRRVNLEPGMVPADQRSAAIVGDLVRRERRKELRENTQDTPRGLGPPTLDEVRDFIDDYEPTPERTLIEALVAEYGPKKRTIYRRLEALRLEALAKKNRVPRK